MNLHRLRGEIVANYGTQKRFSEAMGWHQNKVTAMLTGKYIPDVNEANEMAERLRLPENVFCDIFLAKKSPYGDANCGVPRKEA